MSEGVNSIPEIGSALSFPVSQTAKFIGDNDYNCIKSKLKMVSDCGDIYQQNEVARRVALRLTNRYKDQLIRLHNQSEDSSNGWCSCCKKIIPFVKKFDDREPAKRVATFAVSYIISAIADQSITKLGLTKATDEASLEEMLVELCCLAKGSTISIPKCIYDDPNQYLPPAIPDRLNQQQPASSTDDQVRYLSMSKRIIE